MKLKYSFLPALLAAMLCACSEIDTYEQSDFYTIGSDEVPSVASILKNGEQIFLETDSTDEIQVRYIPNDDGTLQNLDVYRSYLTANCGFNEVGSQRDSDSATLYKHSSDNDSNYIYVKIDSDESNSYLLTVTKSKAVLTSTQAIELLTECTAEQLDLPAELSEYTLIPDEETIDIDGIECYAVNVFSDLGTRLYNMGNYYVACDGSKIFRFDIMSDSYAEVNIPQNQSQ